MRKMKIYFLLFVFMGFGLNSYSQTKPSPYEWEWLRDGIWTGAGIGLSATGYILILNKDDITEAELYALDKDDINFVDRWLAGNYSKDAIVHSYIPFGLSFAGPFILLFDDEVNDHTLQIMGLYIESLATTAAIYTVTAGLINRSRPYVYPGSEASLTKKLQNNGQRSFYSGHVAATATATFFAAKVYMDFHPDSHAKAYIWTGAAVLPAVVGFFRLQAGQHFLTDVLLGYALGAATGYFIPVLHKNPERSIGVFPTYGRDLRGIEYRGIGVSFKF